MGEPVAAWTDEEKIKLSNALDDELNMEQIENIMLFKFVGRHSFSCLRLVILTFDIVIPYKLIGMPMNYAVSMVSSWHG